MKILDYRGRCCLCWRAGNEVVSWQDSNSCIFVLNHHGSEGSKTHPVVIEDITVFYSTPGLGRMFHYCDENISRGFILSSVLSVFSVVIFIILSSFSFQCCNIYHTKSDNFIQVTWRYEMSMTQTYILNDT